MIKTIKHWYKMQPACGKVFMAGATVMVAGLAVAFYDLGIGGWTMLAGFMACGLGMCMAIVRAGKERDEWDKMISNGRMNGNGVKMDGDK